MAKTTGNGTIVKVDHDGDATYTTVGCTSAATVPGRMFSKVDVTCFENTLEQFKAGIEEDSQFVFTQVWDPTSSNHQIIDNLAGGDPVNWQVVVPFATPQTATFAGWVQGYTPSELTPKGNFTRQVTVQRTGAISWA